MGAARPRDSMFFILSGLLIIVSGILVLFRIKLIEVPMINFIRVIGLVLIVTGLFFVLFNVRWRVYAGPTSTFLLAVSIVVFILSSARFPITTPGKVEVHTLMKNQSAASIVNVKISVSTGNIKISRSASEDLIYNITFHKISIPFFMEESRVTFTNKTADNMLFVEATSDISNIEIEVGTETTFFIDLLTSTGNIKVSLEGDVRVESLMLKSSTGNVEIEISNVPTLSSIKASTSVGSLRFRERSDRLAANQMVELKNDVGSIYVNIDISKEVGCEFRGMTNLGVIKTGLSGFREVETTTTKYVHVRSENYPTARYSIMIATENSIGDIYFYGKL